MQYLGALLQGDGLPSPAREGGRGEKQGVARVRSHMLDRRGRGELCLPVLEWDARVWGAGTSPTDTRGPASKN